LTILANSPGITFDQRDQIERNFAIWEKTNGLKYDTFWQIFDSFEKYIIVMVIFSRVGLNIGRVSERT
jgi:hypothetical protein